MIWYHVPVERTEDGSAIVVARFGPSILHVLKDPTVLTALLGCAAAVDPLPDGWTALTLEDAKTEFAAMYGVSPTNEVF